MILDQKRWRELIVSTFVPFLVACGSTLPAAVNQPLGAPSTAGHNTAAAATTISLPPVPTAEARPVTSIPIRPPPTTLRDPTIPTALGAVSIGMAVNDLLKLLGEPQIRTTSQGAGLPEWHFANGLIIDLSGSEESGAVRGMSAHAPFAGKTKEGFGLGDTQTTFAQLYSQFTIRSFQAHQQQITDGHGLYFSVQFDANNKAAIITILREG